MKIISLLSLLMINTSLFAQKNVVSNLTQKLYTIELVIQEAKTIQLDPAKQRQLINQAKQNEKALIDLKWNRIEAKLKMKTLLEQSTVDEQQLIRQLDQLNTIKSNITKIQIKALLQVKSMLTKEQCQLLDKIKKGQRPKRKLSHQTPPYQPEKKLEEY